MVVPLPSSPIPFMPKFANTTEEQTLFILDHNRAVIESIMVNSGVPYSDTFDLRMKRTLTQTEDSNRFATQTKSG